MKNEDLQALAKNLKNLSEQNRTRGPQTDEQLHKWISDNLGLNIPRVAVCDNHNSPFEFVSDIYFERVDSAIAIASRDGGKTMASALIHLLNSLFKPNCESITVGAIWAQSDRAYENLKKLLKWHGKVPSVDRHPDIERSIQAKTTFKNGSTVEILPGCLPEHAMIVTPDGNKRIQEIVSNKLVGPVKTFNFEENKFEWAEITDWHYNGQGNQWLQMKLEDSTLQGPSDIYCTPGHKLITSSGIKKSAIEFDVGDELAIETRILSDEQKQIAIGMLLGDAYVHTNKRYRVCHAAHQLDYLEWFANCFSEFIPYIGRRISKNTYDCDLQCSRTFSQLRREWYPHGQKRVPDYIWEELDILGLACWLMDDGCWTIKGGDGTWIINAMNFNSNEREKAQIYFDNLGIHGKWTCIVKDKDQWVWKTLSGHGNYLQALVSDYINVSEKQEKGYKQWIAEPIRTHSDIGITTAKISSIKKNSNKHGRFDITVPPHANYQISSGLIISNTISAVNGPHGPKLHRDEVEIMPAEVFKEANNITSTTKIKEIDENGKEYIREIKAQDWITSTRKYAHGMMQNIMDEVDEAIRNGNKPAYKPYAWCVFEVAEKVENCRIANPNLPEDKKCECDKVVKGKWDDETSRRFSDVCKGRLARSDGYTTLSDIHKKFLENDKDTWEAQKECSRPEVGGLVFPMFTKERYGIKFYEPDPMYGDIYTSTDFGGCYDEKTEILTKRGWVLFSDVNTNDEFASLNPKTEKVEFQIADEIIAKPYHGWMNRWKNNSIDLLVTADHNMLVSPLNGTEKWELISSQNVLNSSKITKTSTGRIDSKEEDFILGDLEIEAEDWAAILGLWLAEGSSELGKTPAGNIRKTGRISITNYDKKIIKEIKTILEKYFFVQDRIDFEEKTGQLRISNPHLYKHLSTLGKAGDKHIPHYAKIWSPKLLNILIEWIAKGDGCKDGNRERIYTGSKKLADDIQEILMYAGFAGDITVRPPRDSIIEGRIIKATLPQFCIAIKKTQKKPRIHNKSCERPTRTTISPSEWGRHNVYCVVLPKYHTLYVRRNGKAVWCGNTNPHAVNWYQVLDHDMYVHGHNQIGTEEPIKKLKAGTIVCFDEIYKAEIGNIELAKLVIMKEEGWKKQYPGFKVRKRFADVAAKAARLDWAKNNPPLPTAFYVTREVPEHIKTCTTALQEDYFVVDTKKCEMFCAEIESWPYKKKMPGMIDEPEMPVDDFNHAMSAFRYAMENIKYINRRSPSKNRPKYGPRKHIIRNVAKSSSPRYLPLDGR